MQGVCAASVTLVAAGTNWPCWEIWMMNAITHSESSLRFARGHGQNSMVPEEFAVLTGRTPTVSLARKVCQRAIIADMVGGLSESPR